MSLLHLPFSSTGKCRILANRTLVFTSPLPRRFLPADIMPALLARCSASLQIPCKCRDCLSSKAWRTLADLGGREPRAPRPWAAADVATSAGGAKQSRWPHAQIPNSPSIAQTLPFC
ncbi:hypothetical protein DPEC_G00046900 [Dallia pectoralis]|uniref:Uncharacterized protein n=1 Tax=Dallia pectoralis TaxID=75939 RepID=A0ACC2HAR2_DALPE|nr:hypothetical protein DPEC_G00046900 [Dallia pectoralis]